jgi:glycylpeptide N-tetradecanoyltransferase
MFQAVYTAGVVLPKPVAQCRYWHRSLKPKKLIEVGFSRLQVRHLLDWSCGDSQSDCLSH